MFCGQETLTVLLYTASTKAGISHIPRLCVSFPQRIHRFKIITFPLSSSPVHRHTTGFPGGASHHLGLLWCGQQGKWVGDRLLRAPAGGQARLSVFHSPSAAGHPTVTPTLQPRPSPTYCNDSKAVYSLPRPHKLSTSCLQHIFLLHFL